MQTFVTRRLQQFAPFLPSDEAALHDATSNVRDVHAGTDLSKEGDAPDAVHLLTSGAASKVKTAADGKRLVVGYMVAGDVENPDLFLLDRLDHGVHTLTPCKVATLGRGEVSALLESRPIEQAFRWCALAEAAMMREWLVNGRRRPAEQRVGHFFCETFLRLRAVGQAEDDSYDLPLEGAILAEMLGLSVVQTNRAIQGMEDHGYIRYADGRVTVRAWPSLRAFCGFDEAYLMLQPET